MGIPRLRDVIGTVEHVQLDVADRPGHFSILRGRFDRRFLEPLEECLQKDAKISGSKELFAQRVALDLWNFLKSFTSGNETEHLVVPRNVFDSWYQKFTTKFRRDPDFLTRNVNVV